MSACEALTTNASAGVAPALRAVDCLASETTTAAFGRLFGSNGVLLPALTILMTLYVAFFAFSLLTGRSRISISALSPRMMTLGLVLTFATSWIAYQSVVWNLAVGGPDQIAGILMGAKGSATQLFADRIDIVFAAISEVESAAGASTQGAAPAAATGSFTPGDLMWLAALLLMLGTVGVLVTARIALAVLLAIGPVFIVFALFPGTRGLFAGWLRGVVMTSVTPLFAVIGGGFMLELVVPVVSSLVNAEGQVDGRASMALFMIAAVHVALMTMVTKVLGTMVGSWQVFGLAPETGRESANGASGNTGQPGAAASVEPANVIRGSQPSRASSVAPFTVLAANDASSANAGPPLSRPRSTVMNESGGQGSGVPSLPSQRARGVGSRFRPSNRNPKGMMR